MDIDEFEEKTRELNLRVQEAKAKLLEAELEAKTAVTRNPWPWIAGAMVVGFIAGAVLL